MRINQYELIKLYNDCVDKRDFINSCIDKYSIETSAWENYWDLIDATIDRESKNTSNNKLKAAIALVIIHYKSEKKHGANTMKINDVIKDFQLLADID